MWIFTSTGMISAVAHRTKPGTFLVRARTREHLDNFISEDQAIFKTRIFEDQRADYRWRVELPGITFQAMVAEAIQAITYDNFKNSIPETHDEYHSACGRVWGNMLALQTGGAWGPDLFDYCDEKSQTLYNGDHNEYEIMGLLFTDLTEMISSRTDDLPGLKEAKEDLHTIKTWEIVMGTFPDPNSAATYDSPTLDAVGRLEGFIMDNMTLELNESRDVYESTWFN